MTRLATHLVRLAVLVTVTCGAVSCGDDVGSPIGPTPTPKPPVVTDLTLTVLVVGHKSNSVLAGVPARLEPGPGGDTSDALQQTTGSDGNVRWRIVSGAEYSVYLRGLRAITAVLPRPGEAQWLVSLPE